jgi:hypothetical protein
MIPPFPRYTYYAPKYKNLLVCTIIHRLQIVFSFFLFHLSPSLLGFSRFALYLLLPLLRAGLQGQHEQSVRSCCIHRWYISLFVNARGCFRKSLSLKLSRKALVKSCTS